MSVLAVVRTSSGSYYQKVSTDLFSLVATTLFIGFFVLVSRVTNYSFFSLQGWTKSSNRVTARNMACITMSQSVPRALTTWRLSNSDSLTTTKHGSKTESFRFNLAFGTYKVVSVFIYFDPYHWMKTLVLFLVAVSLVSSLDAACPHLTVGLQSWKNASSWVSNAVPAGMPVRIVLC